MGQQPDYEKRETEPGSLIGVGIAIGAGAGVALGLALDNLPIGIAIGAGAGIAIGAAREKRRRRAAGDANPGDAATPEE